MQPETIFLHVREDGREEVFTAPPGNIQVTQVWRRGRTERAWTFGSKPRGNGWVYYGHEPIWGSSVWKRFRRRWFRI
jgi:hypothetical protein